MEGNALWWLYGRGRHAEPTAVLDPLLFCSPPPVTSSVSLRDSEKEKSKGAKL